MEHLVWLQQWNKMSVCKSGASCLSATMEQVVCLQQWNKLSFAKVEQLCPSCVPPAVKQTTSLPVLLGAFGNSWTILSEPVEQLSVCNYGTSCLQQLPVCYSGTEDSKCKTFVQLHYRKSPCRLPQICVTQNHKVLSIFDWSHWVPLLLFIVVFVCLFVCLLAFDRTCSQFILCG